jgi:hypothetical protein
MGCQTRGGRLQGRAQLALLTLKLRDSHNKKANKPCLLLGYNCNIKAYPNNGFCGMFG